MECELISSTPHLILDHMTNLRRLITLSHVIRVHHDGYLQKDLLIFLLLKIVILVYDALTVSVVT